MDDVLYKSSLNAGSLLGLNEEETLQLIPTEGSAIDFIKICILITRVTGSYETAAHWFSTNNTHFDDTPHNIAKTNMQKVIGYLERFCHSPPEFGYQSVGICNLGDYEDEDDWDGSDINGF